MNSRQEKNLSLIDGFRETCHVRLDTFDGPLDLLLHLIKENKVDIYDIPIADITKQYLEYIRAMKELNLDVAGDFLLMASTLLQIKSSMLLPANDESQTDEEDDPRAELIRRLMEYQQYKEAGALMGARVLVGREVFTRPCPDADLPEPDHENELLELGLFDLVDAFRAALARIPEESFHEVAMADTLTIADSINEILTLLRERSTLEFDEVVGNDVTRERIIVTFLALLELCRLKMIRVFQSVRRGTLRLYPAVVE